LPYFVRLTAFVHGVQLLRGSHVPQAWSGGGGGFSNHYAQPSYQAEAVKQYIASGVAPASHYYNASGRAYPDVSAFATNFVRGSEPRVRPWH